MAHEMYSYSEGTVLSFQRVHWQGSETDRSLLLVLILWMCGATTPQTPHYNKLSIHWSE